MKKSIVFIIAAGAFVLGQLSMNLAYNMDNLEDLVIQFSYEMHFAGCMTGAGNPKQKGLREFCTQTTQRAAKDIEDIVRNKLWKEVLEKEGR